MAVSDGTSAISNLAVGFGGFSPTAMDEMNASKELVERVEELAAKRKELKQRNREREQARTSETREFAGDGAVYEYVIVDDEFVRITGCSAASGVLAVPAEIESKPVYAIGSEAFARLGAVTEIVCPDSVESIGSCAFRLSKNLRRVVFPAGVSDFTASWLQGCDALEEIVLPGLLDAVSSSVFENAGLKRLVIGASVQEVKSSAFEKSQLEHVEVDPANPFIKTDGFAIYSNDGLALHALARPVELYRVADGCKAIADKAFYGMKDLEQVELPDSVEVIADFAFSHSGLVSFVAPPNLRGIEERAFFHCRELEEVSLNDGIVLIGSYAFAETGISELLIPGSIENLGTSVAENTAVVLSGLDATLKIDESSKSLFLDGKGGLYRREDDGNHLIQLIDPAVEVFEAAEGTLSVDDHAFAFNRSIEEVSFPDGLVKVGESAFRVCENLKRVELPDSVREIGADAFYDTSLESFHVPSSLVELGENSLVTMGVRRGNGVPSLKDVTIGDGNSKFFLEGGMLCERREPDVVVLLYLGEEPEVVVPDEVTHIAPFAFGNARGIESLSLGPNIRIVGSGGLAVTCWIRDIHVEIAEPVEGRREFEFHFPHTPKAVHEINLALGGSSWVNVPDIMKHFDNCVASCHDYNSKFQDGVSAYDQVKLVLERLRDPILMSNTTRGLYDRLFRQNICEICVDIARHDDRAIVDELVERGYLNEGNLENVISEVGKLQDAAMTGYLLELKRTKFGQAAIDFDL